MKLNEVEADFHRLRKLTGFNLAQLMSKGLVEEPVLTAKGDSVLRDLERELEHTRMYNRLLEITNLFTSQLRAMELIAGYSSITVTDKGKKFLADYEELIAEKIQEIKDAQPDSQDKDGDFDVKQDED